MYYVQKQQLKLGGGLPKGPITKTNNCKNKKVALLIPVLLGKMQIKTCICKSFFLLSLLTHVSIF